MTSNSLAGLAAFIVACLFAVGWDYFREWLKRRREIHKDWEGDE